MRYVLRSTSEFTEWFESLDEHSRNAVAARAKRLQDFGHFGDAKRFDGIVELRWKNGLRVYGVELRPDFILLYGGTKNGQQKDIRKAIALASREKIRR